MSHASDARRLLIVEDEPKLAQLLKEYFQQADFSVHCIHHGDEVMPWLAQHPVELILLDVMLPGRDGLSLCKGIRSGGSDSADTPIIMVTARVEEIDRLLGLEFGADDYICKPFSPREVVARARAVLRRYQPQSSSNSPLLQLDPQRFIARLAAQQVELTAVEFQLFHKLYSEPGRIFSRAQLMDSMYSDHRVVSDRTIDSHIKKLRKKFKSLSEQEIIHSVYGAGYRFELPEAGL